MLVVTLFLGFSPGARYLNWGLVKFGFAPKSPTLGEWGKAFPDKGNSIHMDSSARSLINDEGVRIIPPQPGWWLRIY